MELPSCTQDDITYLNGVGLNLDIIDKTQREKKDCKWF
jgi:hypothetical protein